MTTDLTSPEARDQRDALADHAEVLDKVGALMLLPGDTYATSDLVAGYYGVTVNAVQLLAADHLDELTVDGYRVLRGEELTVLKTVSGLGGNRAPALAVFPRRAILRVGMLLRESLVAKAVRTALLDAERAERPVVDVTAIDRRMLARMVIEAEDRADAAEARLVEVAPKVEYVDRFVSNDDLITFRVLANRIGRGEQEIRDTLIARKWIYRQFIGSRFSSKQGRLVDEWEYRAKADKKAYFQLIPQHNAPRHHNNQLRQTLYITPQGALAVERLLSGRALAVVS